MLIDPFDGTIIGLVIEISPYNLVTYRSRYSGDMNYGSLWGYALVCPD